MFELIVMRRYICLLPILIALASCHSNGNGNTAKTFCDTTCNSDSITFKEDVKFNPNVSISMKDCRPDTLTWVHEMMSMTRQVDLQAFMGQPLRLSKSAISCVFKDTSYAWLTFNDCITGRGYLLKLPFSKRGETIKSTGALNSFDPKFSLDKDLRAYTDRGNVFVVDVNTGKEAEMTFGKSYDIDFNNIHTGIDSINVTHKRIYVSLIDEGGKKVPLEKTIDL